MKVHFKQPGFGEKLTEKYHVRIDFDQFLFTAPI